MKVTLERLPESRVQLQIEIDDERLEKSLDSAYKRLAQKNRFPGFRPGKAPRPIVERAVGREGLIREALDKLVPAAYNEAIETENVDAIGQPDLEIEQLEPVKFTATVPIRPTVALNDYHSIRVDPEPVEVTSEMVEEQVLLLRRRHATQVPVDRAIQWDDVIIADVKASEDGNQFLDDENAEFPLREGKVLFVPGLAEEFLGMNKGDEKTFDIAVPEDFQVEQLKGKTATFTLTIHEVKEEQLPEADDEFANLVNADEFPDFASLRARIESDMKTSLENDAESKFRNSVIDKLVEGATLEYPRVLVEHEIDHLVREAMGNNQQQYQMYLQQLGRSEADFRETWREAADMRLRRSLVISELAEAEGLDVSAEEIEEELDTLVAPMGDDAARFRQMFATEEGVSTIRRNLLSRKTLERLAAIARGELQEEQA
ncbi:MAG: trigger factor [Chloroflexi bacterium]|nr:trigger factor [Dehalococcoidia bacterium]MCZ7576379.1 trigger factor [Dehalococcoidia bacterium]NJD64664.1 trigger factor [Chloroflexota bacterium]PWB71912.1 MAG: trigger factor [Holophagae bacterium]